MTLPDHPTNAQQRLRILFATVSGTARQVAEALAMEAADQPGLAVDVLDMHLADAATVFDPRGPLLILCIATTGSGDVPDDAQAIYAELMTNPRYLGGLNYGVVALGDSSYGSTFCGGGQLFDAVLQDLGASRSGEILQLDAMEEPEPEQAAIRWFGEWRKTALKAT